MPTPSELLGPDGVPLHTFKHEFNGIVHDILVVNNPQKVHGRFKSVTHGATTTQRLATPDGNGHIELTDLIITTEKKSLSVLTVQFNDGTDVEVILTAYLADAPVGIAIAFQGGWTGWQKAYVEVDMTGAAALGSTAIGFIKHTETFAITYTAWLERRS